MRSYAATYPELVIQARTQEAGDSTLERLSGAYGAAQVVFDGVYRGCGEPLVGHMVRTASVVLAEDQPVEVGEAALLHSAYDLWRYDGTTRRRPRATHRRWLQRHVGRDAEALVWGFRQLEWISYLSALRSGERSGPEPDPRVLVLYLANEVSNHLDLAKAYRRGWPFQRRIEVHGETIVELARDMGFPVLADELITLYDQHLHDALPPLAGGEPGPYELPARRTWQASAPGRGFIRARRAVGRRVRRRLARSTPARFGS